MMTTSLDIQWT